MKKYSTVFFSLKDPFHKFMKQKLFFCAVIHSFKEDFIRDLMGNLRMMKRAILKH